METPATKAGWAQAWISEGGFSALRTLRTIIGDTVMNLIAVTGPGWSSNSKALQGSATHGKLFAKSSGRMGTLGISASALERTLEWHHRPN